jgi:hypothetical protein
MSGIRNVLSCLLACLLLTTSATAQGNAPNETAKKFVGMWKLVSIVGARGQVTSPTGFIVYDASGFMTAQIMPALPRPNYAGPEPTPDEAKAALTGYTAYFGTWTVDERAGTITHHRTGDIDPPGVGTDIVRKYEFGPGDRVTLTIQSAKATNGTRVTWERVK